MGRSNLIHTHTHTHVKNNADKPRQGGWAETEPPEELESPFPSHWDYRHTAEPTLDRNQPADPPLLLWPTLIFINCPKSGASSRNLSSAPFSKLSFSFSSLRSPVCKARQARQFQKGPEERKEASPSLDDPPTERRFFENNRLPPDI